MSDETGALEKGKLVWRLQAWRQFLLSDDSHKGGQQREDEETLDHSSGCNTEENDMKDTWKRLTDGGAQALREKGENMIYRRVMLAFGWSPEVERLCVLGVEW